MTVTKEHTMKTLIRGLIKGRYTPLVIIVALLVGAAIINGLRGDINTASQQNREQTETIRTFNDKLRERDRAEKQREQDMFGFALAVRELQRNPASFTVEDAYIGKNDSNCIVYRSQNGFGGMNRGRAVESSGQRWHDQSGGFSKAWNKACTESQRDLRRYVQYNIEHAGR
jgi:hypothetical protein